MVDKHSANTQEQSDRRKSPRVRTCFTVTYKLSKFVEMQMLIGDKEVSAIMIDLSQDGMAILTEVGIPEKALLSMKFTLINEFERKSDQVRPMEIEGVVKYNIYLKEKAYRLGILFTNMSEDDKYAIANFVRMSKAWDPDA